MMLIAAAGGVVCMFLPWVSFLGFSINGMHDWGVLVFLCFVVAGVMAFIGDQTKNLPPTNWMIALIASAIAALVMVINFFNLTDSLGGLSFGFYGAVAAAVALLAFTFMYRSASDSLQSGFDVLKKSFNNNTTTIHTGDTTTTTTTSTTNVSHTPTNDPTRPTV